MAGVGIGRSLHAGQVTVADGTPLAAQKIERVLTNDPGMGVIRHVDAGYDLAESVADERGVRVPMREGSLRMTTANAERFAALWRSLLPIGRDGNGGYLRYGWADGELACREWFAEEAADRDMTLHRTATATCSPGGATRRSGDAVLTGSHFDSVPHGGAYDGPLGVRLRAARGGPVARAGRHTPPGPS